MSIRNPQGVPKAWISRRVGGNQIDYADEQPEIRKIFADEMAKHGMEPKMDPAYSRSSRPAAEAGRGGVATVLSLKSRGAGDSSGAVFFCEMISASRVAAP